MERSASPGHTLSATDASPVCIRFASVEKVFDGTRVLSGVTFDIHRGEVHALLGANGAGKSTLIKVLSGFYHPDAGEVEVTTPDGELAAVSFIHQDLALVGDLTVAENIALLRGYPRRVGRISWTAVRQQAIETLDLIGGGIDPDAKVGELSRADQSLVAIARAVSTKCSALVLDEPTASLPDADVEKLFEILALLKARGVSILYVTHRLDEVRRIADRVTILRDGRVVVDEAIAELSDRDIVSAIVGGELTKTARRSGRGNDVEVMRITGGRIATYSPRFDLRIARGEVLGLAGLRSAGHEEVGRALAGIEPLESGEVAVEGRMTRLRSVGDAIARGIGFATSRREQEALAMTLSARENFFINPGAMKGKRSWFISPRRERAFAHRLASDVRLRPPTSEAVVATFSGGNQQKVVLGRWLSVDLKVLILEEPTMGIDVGARAEIYSLIHSLADAGLAVVVISSDFEELAMICERVLVFDRGRICAELFDERLTVDSLIHHASGAQLEDLAS
jgi:ribose transport system ATP-binding protein